MSIMPPASDCNNIGEYALRITGPRGTVMHLIHYGELTLSRPTAGCGIDRADWSAIDDDDTRCLRLCKTCAQHANDRGVLGDALIEGGLR